MRVIAALITCHNRKAKTIACLNRLFSQTLPLAYIVNVYLVDDNCTDGTAEAVQEEHPGVTILKGDGSLFWCKGMRLAWEHAAKEDPEFYLWLNDDTLLGPNCLATLLAVWNESAGSDVTACIVVGSCRDPISAEHSYGGQLLRGHHPAKLSPIVPDVAGMKRCDTFNGNCVLVGRAAFRTLGMMRPFKHAMADTDYGLTAARLGVRLVVAPGYLATCRSHSEQESWQCRGLPRKERWRMLLGHKGLPPGDWWKFLWAHTGLRALQYWPRPYIRVLMGL